MTRTAILSSLVLGMGLLACDGGGDDKAAAKPKVEAVTGKTATKKGGFDQLTFKCCDDPALATLGKTFADLGTALAADDLERSKVAAGAFAAASTAGTAAAGAPGPAIAAAGAAGASAADLDGIRAAYLDASAPMLKMAKAHKGGDVTLAVAYCPMKPGRWLQRSEPLANPYYGAEMLTCGVFEPL